MCFWATNTYCWIMLSFPSTNSPESFSLGLLSVYSMTSLYLCLGLPRLRCRTFHLAFLRFLRFPWAILKPLNPSERHPFPSVCLKVCSIPLPMLPIKMLNGSIPILAPEEHHWCPFGHQAVEHRSLGAAIQPVPCSLSDTSVKPMTLQFRD